MARMTSMDALEKKIEKAQEQVSRTKKQYDAAVAKLSDLLDKRDALRREELIKAIAKSDRTYEEVLAFLGTEPEEIQIQNGKNNRRGRKTKSFDR